MSEEKASDQRHYYKTKKETHPNKCANGNVNISELSKPVQYKSFKRNIEQLNQKH